MPEQPMKAAVEAAEVVLDYVDDSLLPTREQEIVRLITKHMAPAIEAAFKEAIMQEAALNGAVVSDAGLERCWLRSKAFSALGDGGGG